MTQRAEDPERARYRLDVVGTDMVAVVTSIGGWIVDRALAGWDVRVLLAECSDDIPLRVLGASAHDLCSTLASASAAARPDAFAVAAALLRDDTLIRYRIAKALRHRKNDVTIWPEYEQGDRLAARRTVEHQLSHAAIAFKTRALLALDLPSEAAAPVEVVHVDCERWDVRNGVVTRFNRPDADFTKHRSHTTANIHR